MQRNTSEGLDTNSGPMGWFGAGIVVVVVVGWVVVVVVSTTVVDVVGRVVVVVGAAVVVVVCGGVVVVVVVSGEARTLGIAEQPVTARQMASAARRAVEERTMSYRQRLAKA
ncbi:MAG: hypothetical protein KJN71_06515 [Acidimicrobiia bacterium]|nr:hypothetical protein [Acidimicrobiia bacterium]